MLNHHMHLKTRQPLLTDDAVTQRPQPALAWSSSSCSWWRGCFTDTQSPHTVATLPARLPTGACRPASMQTARTSEATNCTAALESTVYRKRAASLREGAAVSGPSARGCPAACGGGFDAALHSCAPQRRHRRGADWRAVSWRRDHGKHSSGVRSPCAVAGARSRCKGHNWSVPGGLARRGRQLACTQRERLQDSLAPARREQADARCGALALRVSAHLKYGTARGLRGRSASDKGNTGRRVRASCLRGLASCTAHT